jgi:hypothetical protein
MTIENHLGLTVMGGFKSAVLARPIISKKNTFSHVLPRGSFTKSSLGVSPVGMSSVPRDLTFFTLKPTCANFCIFGQEFIDMRPVVVRSMSGLISHLGNRRMVSLFESSVPSRFSPKIGFSAIGMMPNLVLPDLQLPINLGINRKWSKGFFTTALTNQRRSIKLSFGNRHIATIQDNWKKAKDKKGVNCWNILTVMPRTISSQGSQECDQGSETRAWSPDRTVKPQERTPRKGRYSPNLRETVRSRRINRPAITMCPYTGLLENLSKFAVRQPVMKALKADANMDLDALCHNQFNQTPLRYSVAGSSAGVLDSGSSASLTNSIAFNTIHWKDIVDKMRERNIPYYTGKEYVAIGWPTTWRAVKNALESLHQYTETGLELIFNGEIGRYENTRAVEQTNVAKGSADDVAAATRDSNALANTADAWNNGLSDWIYFFGEDTVTEAIAVPEEVRAKIPSDYGRSKGVAWYALLGYGLVHSGLGNSTPAQARIVKWTSAA